MTKQVNDDDLKCALGVDDMKVEVAPKIIDAVIVITPPNVMGKPKSKIKVRIVEAKVTVKENYLEKATGHLYDLEDTSGPEKPLNIDFGLYQMEDY